MLTHSRVRPQSTALPLNTSILCYLKNYIIVNSYGFCFKDPEVGFILHATERKICSGCCDQSLFGVDLFVYCLSFAILKVMSDICPGGVAVWPLLFLKPACDHLLCLGVCV